MLNKAAAIGNVPVCPWHLLLLTSRVPCDLRGHRFCPRSRVTLEPTIFCLYLHSGPLFQSSEDSFQMREIQKGYVCRVHSISLPSAFFFWGRGGGSHRIRDTKMTQVVDSRSMCGGLSQIWNSFFSYIPSKICLYSSRSQIRQNLNSHSFTSPGGVS